MDTRQKFSFGDERLAHFVNREEQLERASEIIIGPAGESLPVIVFYGSGGMGKTSLLHKIRHRYCQGGREANGKEPAPKSIPHALVDFAAAAAATEGGVRTRTGMLRAVAADLEAHGLDLTRFWTVWGIYQQLVTMGEHRSARLSKKDVAALGRVLQEAPVLGPLVKLVQEGRRLPSVEAGRLSAMDMAGAIDARQPEQVGALLASALAADILKATSDRKLQGRYVGYCWPVLMFDSVKWLAGADEEGGLTLEAIRELCEHLPQVPVIIGRRREVEWGSAIGEREVEQCAVDYIPEDYREEFLAKRAVAEDSWPPIIEVTQGHALWMGVAADIALEKQRKSDGAVTVADLWDKEALSKDGKPKLDKLMGRLLERVGEGMADLVRAACVCRWFDRELLRAVAGTTGTLIDEFERLRGFSFVAPVAWDEDGEATRWAIHQVVRELTLAELREEGLLEEFARRGVEHCEAKGEDWVGERIYFLMMADPEEGIRLGGEVFTEVDLSWHRELGQAALQAGRDGWWAAHRGEGEQTPEPWSFQNWEGYLAWMSGEPKRALEAYGKALAGANEQGNEGGRARMLNSIGVIHWQQGRNDEAMELYEESLAIFRELADKRGEAATLNNVAGIRQAQGMYGEAIALYAESLKIKRKIGDRRAEGGALNNMAAMHQLQGRYDSAMRLHDESLAVCRELGDRHGEGQALHNMANAHQLQGRYDKAMGMHERSLKIKREIGDRGGEGLTLNNMGEVHRTQGRYDEAMALYEGSLEISRELGDRRGEATTIGNMANACQSQGRYEEAIGMYRQGLVIQREIGDRNGERQTLNNMAGIYQARGAYDEAMGMCEESLRLAREIGGSHGEGIALMNMGRVMAETGEMGKAKGYWGEALQVLEGMGVPEEEQVKELLASSFAR